MNLVTDKGMWATYEMEDLFMPQAPSEFHIVPRMDLKPHDLVSDCWCTPQVMDSPTTIFKHISMDGREHITEGIRKTS